MLESSREQRLAAAFAEFADALVEDFDVIDFLHRLAEHSVGLLEVCGAGVILALPGGPVIDVAASDEPTRRLEMAGVEWDEGPCHDCCHAGSAVAEVRLDVADARMRWPRFAPRALELGYTSVMAAPLRARGQVIGALNLFGDQARPLSDAQLRLGQALADTAAIGILQQLAVHDHSTVVIQLQRVVANWAIIEQAKGSLAERRQISIEEAFTVMRAHARAHKVKLTDIAVQALEGTGELMPPSPSV